MKTTSVEDKDKKLEQVLANIMLCYLGTMKNKIFCIDPVKYNMNIEEINAKRNFQT